MARFENRLRVERTIGVEKILTKEGYWCRAAPTGFRNGRLDGKPVLLPTEEPGQWELLRYGLRKQLAGVYTLAEVAGETRGRRGCGRGKGNPLCKQTWSNICRSPVYGGLLERRVDGRGVRPGEVRRPAHPRRVAGTAAGARRQEAVYRRVRPAPGACTRLSRCGGSCCCPGCGRPARGYQRGRARRAPRSTTTTASRPACAFRVRAGEAHEAFLGLLRRVTPAAPLLQLFREVVLRVWEDEVRNAGGDAAERPRGRRPARNRRRDSCLP